MKHYAVIPFRAFCGADEPNQATTTIESDVSCAECLSKLVYRGYDYPPDLIGNCPPVYQHYKGGFYRKLFIAKLSEDHTTEMVVYWSIEKNQVWTKRLKSAPGVDSWEDMIVWPDGVTRPRFILVQAGVT